MLLREESAVYVRVSTTKFDEMVKDGRMPKPLRIDGCVRWDIRKLDAALDALDTSDEDDQGWGDMRA